MINLRNSPFFWMALVLLATFWCCDRLDVTFSTGIMSVVVVTLISGTAGALMTYSGRWYAYSTIGLGIMLISAACLHFHQWKKSVFPGVAPPVPVRVFGWTEVDHRLKEKENALTLVCRNLSLRTIQNGDTLPFRDKFLLVSLKEKAIQPAWPKDAFIMDGWLIPLSAPANPYSFDVQTYYKAMGIRAQVTLRQPLIMISPKGSINVFRVISMWQHHLADLVSGHVKNKNAQIINALVWGDRSSMESAVRDAFARAGAMHILSVSGMHVAMIYSMLLFILGKPGEGTFWRRVVRFSIYALFILLYIGLTGASPAVVRAGLMILLYLLGKSMGWNTQVWNLIGFAAFVMLWVNPFVFQLTGFQLSFLAMIGILLFTKPIARTFSFQYKWANTCWEICAVSLAAQIFLLPVLLAQFHQFPVTFILSSFVAIPFGYLLLMGTVLSTFLSFLGLEFLWPLLDRSCALFFSSMEWLAGLNPKMQYSFPALSAWLLSGVVVFFSAGLVYRWAAGKYLSCGFCLLFVLQIALHRHTQWHTKEMVIYSTYRGWLVDVFWNGKVYTQQSGNLASQEISFAASGLRCERDAVEVLDFFSENKMSADSTNPSSFILETTKGSFLFLKNDAIPVKATVHTDFVVINSCKPFRQFEAWLCQADPKGIVFLASCPSRELSYGLKIAGQLGIQAYAIGQQGCFRMAL